MVSQWNEKLKVADKNILLQAKYNITAIYYDILDYPWERIYKKWRPELLKDVRGKVLEAGVGTGRNLKHYHDSVELVCVDISDAMINKAKKRANNAHCRIKMGGKNEKVIVYGCLRFAGFRLL
ncbi:class I SAM-dependent methyltransferase [bacterium]|nr:class I SAM-dependent methyltransferase [Candidatus Omnitrophota bacterium]MBU2527920.1 class I SAM-dependent methyltransferase [bacterium]MBU3929273.1 class I SAM-dependent methyltransferase [bacterium]MBU4122246.1 class I SAM-dependent methyltransferase [bacterium]